LTNFNDEKFGSYLLTEKLTIKLSISKFAVRLLID